MTRVRGAARHKPLNGKRMYYGMSAEQIASKAPFSAQETWKYVLGWREGDWEVRGRFGDLVRDHVVEEMARKIADELNLIAAKYVMQEGQDI